MKWFCKATRYESEIVPRARVVWCTTLSYNDDGTVLNKGLYVRTTYKRWMKYIDPWSFGRDEGWCTFNFRIVYVYRTKKFIFDKAWEPLRVEDLI